MEQLYFVVKSTGNVIVTIMLSKQDGKFHFVNLTKGHICECGFDSIEDAIRDMQRLKENGVLNYFKI